jgi:hypothetical protein
LICLGLLAILAGTFGIWRTRNGDSNAPQGESSCVLQEFWGIIRSMPRGNALHEVMKLYSYLFHHLPCNRSYLNMGALGNHKHRPLRSSAFISYHIAFNNAISHSRSQQSLPSQLDLPRSLSRLEPSFAHACHATIAKLDLVFNFGECARAVMREVNAAERVRAEVFVAMG